MINNEYFSIGKKDKVHRKFVIKHYAGPVKYNSDQFVIKNKNTFEQMSRTFIESSNNEVLKKFDLNLLNCNIKKIKNKNAITLFKKQLEQLLDIIRSNKQHYIRTIKPNMISCPDNFDDEKVIEQFQYCGIVEAIRISRAGYPVRISREEFMNDFFYIFKHVGLDADIRLLMDCYKKNGKKYAVEDFQVGKTKVFIKQNVYDQFIEWKNDIIL